MDPDAARREDEDSEHAPEGPEDGRSHALVPIGRRRRWRDPGARLVAAVCYFAWLGWLTAPAPLLLLNSRRMRRAKGIPYHLFASAGWSTLIVGIRLVLYVLSTWLGTCEGPRPEVVCNALNLAHLVIVLAFAVLLSGWYGIEALLGREISLPWLSAWARGRADHFLGLD